MDTNTLSRRELMPLLAVAACSLVVQHGSEEKVGGASGPVLAFRKSPFQILYRTPKTIPRDASYCVDIWLNGYKIFSACWTSHELRDYELISMKRGPWIPLLLEMASSCETSLEKIVLRQR